MSERTLVSQLATPEHVKDARRLRLRQRLSRITKAYEQRFRAGKNFVAPLLLGLAVGVAVYLGFLT